jgi:hypothetical protein
MSLHVLGNDGVTAYETEADFTAACMRGEVPGVSYDPDAPPGEQWRWIQGEPSQHEPPASER